MDLEIDFRQSLDDARSAFDWAFSRHGDTRIGVELAAGLTEALLDAGLIHECRTRAEQAIDALEELPPASVDSDTENARTCHSRLGIDLCSWARVKVGTIVDGTAGSCWR
ncbi:hypothetical protein [Paraburkholderia sp. MM5482-R1]|uniref:hypothetical protein n=1 Tax=unclassified Paraburkholderia TaxID=2615204 RepID=UPI003D1AF8FA